MSLRVWLPLNGDLRNQGLNDISVINSNVSIDNNGKIGKCYKFETSPSYLSLPKEAMTSFENQCSVCFWLKILSWKTGWDTFFQAGLGASPWNNYIFGFLRNNSSKCAFSISNGGSSYISGNCSSTINFQLATWYHIGLVYKTGHCLLYINGQLDIDYPTTVIPDFSKITTITIGIGNNKTSYQSNCLMNDFRIYDHALSEQEIKKIAQGLILHYPLNNRGLGNQNLARNTHNLDIYAAKNNLYMSRRGSAEVQLRSDGFYEAKCNANWEGLSFWSNLLNLLPGDKITYSFYVYTNGSSKGFSFYPMMFNSSGVRDTSTGLPISIDGTLYTTANAKTFGTINSTVPQYHYVVFEWNQAVANIISNGGKIQLSIQAHGTWNTGDYVCFFAPKVERGDKATTWSPSPFDDSYTTLQLNDTSVKDISGFNNNANYNNLNSIGSAQIGQALIGGSHNFTFNSDTPIYEVSTNFNHTDNYIIGQSPSLQGRTVTCWVKFKERGNQVVFIDYKSGCSFGIYNTYVPVCNKNISYRTCYNRDIFTANIWYFITIIRNDTDQKMDLYVNGEKQTPNASSDTWSSNVSDKLTIGARTNGTTLFNGQISDFRIYATVLSVDDIKELYENREKRG